MSKKSEDNGSHDSGEDLPVDERAISKTTLDESHQAAVNETKMIALDAQTDAGTLSDDVAVESLVGAAREEAESLEPASTTAQVADLPMIEEESIPPPRREMPGEVPPGAAAPPLVVETDRSGSSTAGCLQSVAMMVVGALLGAALVLSILFAINRDLSWAPRSDVDLLADEAKNLRTGLSVVGGSVQILQNRAGSLEDAAGSLEGSVDSLDDALESLRESSMDQAGLLDSHGSRLENAETGLSETRGGIVSLRQKVSVLDPLQTQVNTLDERIAGVAGDVVTLRDELGTVDGDLQALGGQVDEMAQSTQRSEEFLEGLQTLLAALYLEDPAVTRAITPSQAITIPESLAAGEIFTVTVVPTGTIIAGDAITESVQLTATPAVTDTATLTGTPAVDLVSPDVTAAPTETPAPTESPTAAPVSLSGSSRIQGVIFEDLNRNGLWEDEAEAGLPGVQVVLLTSGQTEVASAITNETGEFAFDRVEPGLYVVVQRDPEGYTSSTLNTLTLILRDGSITNVHFGDFPDDQ
ncbi:MAG: SdrD B-like domain-containing protein [Chloroflexota bacterium]|nr:SdrD B-like domain-containing protein [Chloroflexota bacterium]